MAFKKNSGMAMLEVLIAMLVVGVGVLPLVFLQIQSDKGVISAYTKVEFNAAGLSIMDMVAADKNKENWAFGIASGDCAEPNKCNDSDQWRKRMVDDLLTTVLPNPGSGLVCITRKPLPSAGGAAASAIVDRSVKMTVILWWYSAGMGKSNVKDSKKNELNKVGVFSAADCANLDSFAGYFNIDTVSITRIF